MFLLGVSYGLGIILNFSIELLVGTCVELIGGPPNSEHRRRGNVVFPCVAFVKEIRPQLAEA